MDHSIKRQLSKALSRLTLLLLCAVLVCGMSASAFAATDSEATDGRRGLISVKVGGKNSPCILNGTVTVREQLNKLDITLGELDKVTPDLDTRLNDGDTIVVTRITKGVNVVTGVIPHDIIYLYNPDLKAGEEVVIVEGEDGYGERTYDQLLTDGVVTEETFRSEKIAKEPVTERIEMGFRSKPISDYDFEWEFDENGEPIGYTSVLRGQRSAGYSARDGAGTASGLVPADVGHVAVNPNVIPYGSKLFIQSSDGKYIYGYAIAADTGTALMDGRIAVDCFYDSYEASANHGIKDVDIFVVS